MESTFLYNINYIHCISSNHYFKFFVVIILGLVITFIEDIKILHSKPSLIILLILIITMSFTYLDELGSILFLIIIFVLSFSLNKTKSLKNAK